MDRRQTAARSFGWTTELLDPLKPRDVDVRDRYYLDAVAALDSAGMTDRPPPPLRDTIVKAVLAAIPYAGGSLAIIYEDVRARYTDRVSQIVQIVADEAGVECLAARLKSSVEVEALFLEGLEAASRSGLVAKRVLLAKVVAAAVIDDAEIEPGQLIVQALRDLDAPHVRALARIRQAQDEAASVVIVGEPDDTRRERIEAAASEVGRREPTPVVAVLVRTGVVHQASLTYGGGLDVRNVSHFGRTLLAELKSA